MSFSTAEGIRSGLRDYYENTVKCEDGWRLSEITNNFIGNPCDSKMVKSLIQAMKKADHRRGKGVKRAMPMTMNHMNKLHETISKLKKRSKIERAYVIAANSTAFTI